MHAASAGHTKTVKLLLDYNADPNAVDDVERTAIEHAAGNADVVETMLAHHNTDNGCKRGSALLNATIYGHTDIVKALIDNGIPLEALDNDNSWTPLKAAAYFGHTEIKSLIKDAIKKGQAPEASTKKETYQIPTIDNN